MVQYSSCKQTAQEDKMRATIVYFSVSENTAYVAEGLREGMLVQLNKDED